MYSRNQDGAKKILFITGHEGNVDTVNFLSKKYMEQYDFKMAQVDWWRFATVHNKGICQYEGYMCNGHASECGASKGWTTHKVDKEEIDKLTHSSGLIEKDKRPSMGSEDFADYLELLPGALFRIGTRNEDERSHRPLHNSGIVFDEKRIVAGAEVLAQTVWDLFH